MLVLTVPLLVPGLGNPKVVKVEFENDRVRVLRVRYGPHEKTDLDQRPARAIVALTRTHIRATNAAGPSAEARSDPGTVTWKEPDRVSIENLSDDPVEEIEIEFKQAKAVAVPVSAPASGLTTPREPMPASQEPHHLLKYENQYMRILEVTLEPGESSLFHTHSVDVLYIILADAVVRAQNQGEGWGPENAFKAGAVSFDNAAKNPYIHHLQNVGKSQLHTINVEFLP